MIISIISYSFPQETKRINKDLLIEDVRQLARILESSHPDPYTRGGGKIAFHRRLQEILRTIPEQGMTLMHFYQLICPFVVAVGDSHTSILNPLNKKKNINHPGLPIEFKVIEETLYVSRVYNEIHKPLLGSILIRLEDIPLFELLDRQKKLEAYENKYENLSNLSKSLKTREEIQNLIPEWDNANRIKIILKPYKEEPKKYLLTIPEKFLEQIYYPISKIEIPSTKKSDIVYNFLDKNKWVALLRIDNMSTYREMYEIWSKSGFNIRKSAEWAYRRFHSDEPPDNLSELLAGIPSAANIFKSLVIEMKQADTEILLVDLRKNGGGTSFINDIFLYFLYGRGKKMGLETGYTIQKYSDLYFKNYPESSIDEINKSQPILLEESDYNFNFERKFFDKKTDSKSQNEIWELHKEYMPTFGAELETGKYEAYYQPNTIGVLCCAETFSSGYLMVELLFRLGAKIIGTPSGQAGNSFGDFLRFKLDNTNIRGRVSHKYFVSFFPNDPEKVKILKPHYELTYDKLASYGFDPNAEILLALELLSSRN